MSFSPFPEALVPIIYDFYCVTDLGSLPSDSSTIAYKMCVLDSSSARYWICLAAARSNTIMKSQSSMFFLVLCGNIV